MQLGELRASTWPSRCSTSSPGDEIVTSAVTFSTDIAPMVRKGIVPAFVDVTPDTFQIDVDAIEEMIGPRTRAILAPNLIGNAPDWDRIREIADRHGLSVVEDSCDALGLTLRGTPTGHPRRHQPDQLRPVAHHHCGRHRRAWSASTTTNSPTRRCCCGGGAGARRCSSSARRRASSALLLATIDGDIEYDNLFIFDELGWNFEPSELSAAFGLVQLDKLGENLARRQRNFDLTSCALRPLAGAFHPAAAHRGRRDRLAHVPRPHQARLGHPPRRFQQWMEAHGVDTRMVWTGNAARQPAFRDRPHRTPPAGSPTPTGSWNAGIILPNSHSMTDDDCDYIGECLGGFVTERGLA